MKSENKIALIATIVLIMTHLLYYLMLKHEAVSPNIALINACVCGFIGLYYSIFK